MYPFKQGVRYWPNEELVKSIARRGKPRDRRAVEVGSGSGNNLPVLIEHDYDVCAIDWDAAAVEDSMRWLSYLDYNVEECVDFLVGRADEIRIPRTAVIVDSMMSQHLNDVEFSRFLDRARKAIADDGWMFTYHLTGCTDNLFPEHKDDLFPRSQADLFLKLKRHGFQVKHSWWKEISDANTFAKYVAMESEPC